MSPTSSIRKKWAQRLLLLLALLLTVMVLMFSLQRLFLFPRHATEPLPDAGRGVPGLVHLDVDGPVEGWLLPGDGVSAERPGPAVLFAHGNAELIDYWTEEMARYRRLGVSVLLAEYRGYGRSAGSPSQAAITEDFIKFHDRLTARPEVDGKRIVFHGRSLGGGAVCALASHRRPAALILQSTFTSVRRMARRFLMPGFLVRDPFDNLAVVRELECPLLIVHGTRDRLIPFAQAEELRDAARDVRLVSYPADHNTTPPDWNHFWTEVERFLRDSEIIK
jgi:fermentation-respiration switch protein FrsA (DUF1100 family)